MFIVLQYPLTSLLNQLTSYAPLWSQRLKWQHAILRKQGIAINKNIICRVGCGTHTPIVFI